MSQDIAPREYKVLASKVDRFTQERWFKKLVVKPRFGTVSPVFGKSINVWIIDTPTLTKVFASLNKQIEEARKDYERADGTLAENPKLDNPTILQGVSRNAKIRFRQLANLRTAIIKAVDLGSRPLVLGVTGPVPSRAEVIPEYATYTVYIHVVDGLPVAFMGDRFGPPHACGSSKSTKYETPTDLATLKSQMRTVIKAMRERGDPDLMRVNMGWSWISYKITGVRKPEKKS